ncbi:ENTPD3 [Branchiostoma lanceolatum]|uniref:ENTPD3 protein n=2 Tax=Branchiostoma lanceolatum TaxID=7740 RepID=A0A8J9Z6S6_BRALA|nr:ENTPD3 [Branchiostoma lanceolatum]
MEPNLRVCFVLSAFLGGIVFVSSARVGRDSHNYRYGVILDAGSSSTKLHVYRWDRNSLPTKKADLTEVKLPGTRKVRPGISSYVASPQFVKTALILLLYSAKAAVPKELHSSTPVYLKATAGMRLLKPADADAIFDQINELFQNPTFNPFKFERGWAKVISGEEEGVYGWITVNFLKGVFDSKTDMKTFGALDMGGGSTQITFLPTGQFYANLFPLYIAGKRYDLYTNSFLKFGLDQFRLQIYQYLYQQATDKNATIDNPCDLQGYNSAVDIGGSKVAKIKGTGNPNRQCRALVRQLLGLNDTCYTEPCSIIGEYQPPVGDSVFYATAAYYYVSQVGGGIGAVNKNGGFTSVNNIQGKTDDYCALSYAQATNQSGEYGYTRCAAGNYVAALLSDGYKIERSATDKVYITKEINGVEIGWALGSMMYELYLLNIQFAVGSASHVTPTSLDLILAILPLMWTS